MTTVPDYVRLARHTLDLDDDGHDIYAGGTDDQTAAEVPFTPAAGIAATDVQAAIVEDAGDLAAHLADTTDAHDASAVSIVDAGGYYTGTDVEAALQEVGAEAAVVYAPVMASSPNIVTTDGAAVYVPLVTTDGQAILAVVP